MKLGVGEVWRKGVDVGGSMDGRLRGSIAPSARFLVRKRAGYRRGAIDILPAQREVVRLGRLSSLYHAGERGCLLTTAELGECADSYGFLIGGNYRELRVSSDD